MVARLKFDETLDFAPGETLPSAACPNDLQLDGPGRKKAVSGAKTFYLTIANENGCCTS